MASLGAEILDRANARAQRRFRRMIVEQAYAFPGHRLNRLYHQAERLVDALEVEIAWSRAQVELERIQQNDPESPDYFALFATEAENRALWGDR